MSQCISAVGMARMFLVLVFKVPCLRLSLQKRVVGSPKVCLFVCF